MKHTPEQLKRFRRRLRYAVKCLLFMSEPTGQDTRTDRAIRIAERVLKETE
jgi:hypothetical protein